MTSAVQFYAQSKHTLQALLFQGMWLLARAPLKLEPGVAWWPPEQWMVLLTLIMTLTVLIPWHLEEPMPGGRWIWGVSMSSATSPLPVAEVQEMNAVNIINT